MRNDTVLNEQCFRIWINKIKTKPTDGGLACGKGLRLVDLARLESKAELGVQQVRLAFQKVHNRRAQVEPFHFLFRVACSEKSWEQLD
eukprot:s1603_g8.t1